MAQYFDLQSHNQVVKHQNILLGIPLRENIEKVKDSIDSSRWIIIDNLQECDIPVGIDLLEPYKDKILLLTMGSHPNHPWLRVISVPNWMWYFESLWYRARGYHQYQPNLSECPRLFFMPIRTAKPGRELIYNRLRDLLGHDAIFSYVDRGIELPGIPDVHRYDQRWFNPQWYDNTLFSVVNEDSSDVEPKVFSEKSCKPLAFYHPFILMAQQGVLEMIRDAGFQTFPELFDESYDLVPDLTARADFVNQQIRSVDRSSARSPEVMEKLKHNHNRFFDQHLVFDLIEKEVINPMIDFLSQ